MNYLYQFILAFCACVAFSVVFGLRKSKLIFASLGGGISWLAYIVCNTYFNNEVESCFFATIIMSIYCEIMARCCKSPVSIYMVIGLLPLVPGNSSYKAVSFLLQNQTDLAIASGLNTIGIAGSLAIGMVIVSSIFRIFNYKSHIIEKTKI